VGSDHRTVKETVKINIKNTRTKMIRAKKKMTKWNLLDNATEYREP
jgi:hypothetical protein